MRRLSLLLLPLLLAGAQGAPRERTQWRVVVADDGAVIGTISETRSADGLETEATQRFTVQERGDSPTLMVDRTVTRRDAGGAVVAISKERQANSSMTTIEARILPGTAEIVQRSRAVPPVARTVTLPAGIRFDGGMGLIAGRDARPATEIEFLSLNLDAMAIERNAIGPAPATVAIQPGQRALIRRSYDGDTLLSVQLLILDDAGRLVETRQPIFGTVMTIRAATEEEAARPIPPYRPLARALVQSPFRIPERALTGRIRYRFTYRDGIVFPLPVTGEQRVSSAEDGATLDVCADCGSDLPATPEALADALRPTSWLQSDHPRIRELAAPVRARGISDARKMDALVGVVEQQLTEIDFAGHFSAVEALARQRGDCTESAVLLAALGRALGIPTKVASGLVYSRGAYHGTSNVFLPHSWVLAYVDGRWRSYDAALGSFDSSHIALTIGDGDARSIAAANQFAGLITWQEMQEVRRRPQP